MAIDFPNTPATNDTYTVGDTTWKYDGEKWTIISISSVPVNLSDSNPAMNGSVSAGVASLASRSDHVHPSDTSRAALASPTFTGTPAAPTAAVDTNTTQIATTAFVVGQGYSKLNSPTFTGTPAAPTAAVDTNTTQIATTAYVVGQGYAKLASPTFTGIVTSPEYIATADQSTSQNAGAFSYGTLGYSDANILASFASSAAGTYNQLIIQNSSNTDGASADLTISNNRSTATTYYGNFGMNSQSWVGSGAFNSPDAVYLTATSSNLGIGTTTANSIRFAVNNSTTDAMTISSAGNITMTGSLTTNLTTAGLVTTTSGGLLSSSSYPRANADLMGYTSTATAAGTTTLTNTSTQYQIFTGSTTQTVQLPVTSTLVTGWSFHIVNNSTGNLTINSSGGNLVITVLPGLTAMVTCIGTTLTTAADWEAGYTDFSTATGTGSVVLATSPTATNLNLAAGTTALPPLKFNSGTNTSGATQGNMEFDGNLLFMTGDTTNGSSRTVVPMVQRYYLPSPAATIAANTDFFPSGRPAMQAGRLYHFRMYLVFTKNTAGTVTFQLKNSAAVNFTFISATLQIHVQGAVLAALGNVLNAYAAGAATATFTASQSLGNNANLVGIVDGYCVPASNTRLSIAPSAYGAGTLSTVASSNYIITDLGATGTNYGNFG